MNNRILVGAAIGLATLCASVQAQVKDPLPDSLSLGGVTIYGTVDIGYAYQSAGVPLSSSLPGGLEYQSFTTTRNFSGSVSTVAESGLEQSKLGVRVQQIVVNDISLVARAEIGFNPLSGELADACKSLEVNSGVKQGAQTANADSSRCGQLFNAQLYGGFSSPEFGQLTVGRHNALQLDALAMYDPQALAYAFSFLGYSGFDGGSGSTEAARWDNSARYFFTNPAFRFGAMYSNGGADSGMFGHAYGFQLGFTAQGLSMDATYQHIPEGVNLRSSFDNGPAPVPTPGLAAYISDNTSYNIMGRYVFDLADKSKFTLYAGYSHIEKSHADYTGGSAENSYPIDVAINVNSTATYSLYWVGGRYAMSSGLNLVAAYYHASQNSWTIGLGTNGNQNIGCTAAGLLCSGTFDEVSGVLDYVFNKHYDVYAGVNWSEVKDGLANGFQGTTADGTTGSQGQTTFMFGVRVKF
jgi:predicted porin